MNPEHSLQLNESETSQPASLLELWETIEQDDIDKAFDPTASTSSDKIVKKLMKSREGRKYVQGEFVRLLKSFDIEKAEKLADYFIYNRPEVLNNVDIQSQAKETVLTILLENAFAFEKASRLLDSFILDENERLNFKRSQEVQKAVCATAKEFLIREKGYYFNKLTEDFLLEPSLSKEAIKEAYSAILAKGDLDRAETLLSNISTKDGYYIYNDHSNEFDKEMHNQWQEEWKGDKMVKQSAGNGCKVLFRTARQGLDDNYKTIDVLLARYFPEWTEQLELLKSALKECLIKGDGIITGSATQIQKIIDYSPEDYILRNETDNRLEHHITEDNSIGQAWLSAISLLLEQGQDFLAGELIKLYQAQPAGENRMNWNDRVNEIIKARIVLLANKDYDSVYNLWRAIPGALEIAGQCPEVETAFTEAIIKNLTAGDFETIERYLWSVPVAGGLDKFTERHSKGLGEAALQSVINVFSNPSIMVDEIPREVMDGLRDARRFLSGDALKRARDYFLEVTLNCIKKGSFFKKSFDRLYSIIFNAYTDRVAQCFAGKEEGFNNAVKEGLIYILTADRDLNKVRQQVALADIGIFDERLLEVIKQAIKDFLSECRYDDAMVLMRDIFHLCVVETGQFFSRDVGDLGQLFDNEEEAIKIIKANLLSFLPNNLFNIHNFVDNFVGREEFAKLKIILSRDADILEALEKGVVYELSLLGANLVAVSRCISFLLEPSEEAVFRQRPAIEQAAKDKIVQILKEGQAVDPRDFLTEEIARTFQESEEFRQAARFGAKEAINNGKYLNVPSLLELFVKDDVEKLETIKKNIIESGQKFINQEISGFFNIKLSIVALIKEEDRVDFINSTEVQDICKGSVNRYLRKGDFDRAKESVALIKEEDRVDFVNSAEVQGSFRKTMVIWISQAPARLSLIEEVIGFFVKENEISGLLEDEEICQAMKKRIIFFIDNDLTEDVLTVGNKLISLFNLSAKKSGELWNQVFCGSEKFKVIAEKLTTDIMLQLVECPKILHFILKNLELLKATAVTEKFSSVFVEILNNSESKSLRDRQMLYGELMGVLLWEQKYDLIAEIAGDKTVDFIEAKRIVEKLKNFLELHQISGKGHTIATLLAMRDYITGDNLIQLLQKMEKSLDDYTALLERCTAHNIPKGLRASVGIEYEITESTAKGYSTANQGSILSKDMQQVSRFANVGRGKDAVFEIATRPTDNPYLLLLEMQLLQDLEFIDFNFRQPGYELGSRGYHLTIGGESGILISSNSNFLQNALVMSGWGGINAGREVDKLSRARGCNIRQRDEINTLKVFENTKPAVEFRSLSLDTWEPFERAVKTSYLGAVAIQVFEKYVACDNSDKLAEIETNNYEQFYQSLQKEGFIKEETDSAVVKQIIFEWAKLQIGVMANLADYNENFLQNEMYGYEDDKGKWIEPEEFRGDANEERFIKTVGNKQTLESYVQQARIEPKVLFKEATPDLANKLTAITNLFIKCSKKSGGDTVNASASLDTTKIGRGIEVGDPQAKYQSFFDNRGKTREGYYYTQGGSERMLLHAVQIKLLEFNKSMQNIIS